MTRLIIEDVQYVDGVLGMLAAWPPIRASSGLVSFPMGMVRGVSFNIFTGSGQCLSVYFFAGVCKTSLTWRNSKRVVLRSLTSFPSYPGLEVVSDVAYG